MARPRTFDEADALDAAIDCFWRRGYGATSVRDLGDEMGLGSASLYNAFLDKRTLFLRALDRYLDSTMRERIVRLERTRAPKDAVKAFIDEIVERSVNDPERRGCMLINAAAEFGARDPDLREEIAARLDELQGFFRRMIARAREEGSIPNDRDPAELSRLMLGVVVAIRVLARVRPQRALLKGIAKPALALLD
ncbi:MAG TPA: TetR/AcrR family transcriptional regulator [Stellaceae bacterium]|nr:TetR/AcrR family transcriptional regulator [Stellaceae bacterium]